MKFFERQSYSKDEYDKTSSKKEQFDEQANQIRPELFKAETKSRWQRLLDRHAYLKAVFASIKVEEKLDNMKNQAHKEAAALNAEYDRLLGDVEKANNALNEFQKEKLGIDVDNVAESQGENL